MLLAIAIILLILWLAGWILIPTVGWLIHVLLVIAIIVFIFHFVTGRRVP